MDGCVTPVKSIFVIFSATFYGWSASVLWHIYYALHSRIIQRTCMWPHNAFPSTGSRRSINNFIIDVINKFQKSVGKLYPKKTGIIAFQMHSNVLLPDMKLYLAIKACSLPQACQPAFVHAACCMVINFFWVCAHPLAYFANMGYSL